VLEYGGLARSRPLQALAVWAGPRQTSTESTASVIQGDSGPAASRIHKMGILGLRLGFRIDRQRERTMSRDLRAVELNNLKLALAAFAVQLNAFEARLKRRSFETDNRFPPRASDVQFARKLLFAMKGAETDRHIKSR
jgi:hypothetical protein